MTAPRLRRPSRALGFPLLVLALTVGSLLATFGGCGLSTGGIPSGTGGGTACTSTSQCDDGNACTTDACNASGTCTHTGIADGPLPAADQTQGNCKKLVCMGGEPMTEDDPTNVPANTNPCVKEECSGGTALADMTANNGMTCTAGSSPGVCNNGACTVSCQESSQCPDAGPCVVPFCDGATGICSGTNVADGTMTPGYTQVTGDCVVHVCVGGVDTPENDDSDVPSIPSGEVGCADAVCSQGTPSNPVHANNSVCSTYMGSSPGYCDTAGNCVECAADTDCPGNTTDCQHPACTNNVCGTAYATAGTPTTATPAQTQGDCHQVQCDGSGGTQTVVDTTDPPTANACDTFGCDGSGNITHSYHSGASCGTSSSGMQEVCNNMGQCGCQSQSDCPAATCGTSTTVVTLAQSCTNFVCVAPAPSTHDCSPYLCAGGSCTTSCSTDAQCASGAYCNSSGKCTPQGGTGAGCTAADQCQSGFCADSVCCTTACTGLTCQACSAAKKGQGADGICGAVKLSQDPHGDCSNMGAASCGESGGCNGSGACSTYAAGTQCKAPTCAGTTLTQAALCAGGACPGTQTMVNCAPYLCSTSGNGSCTTSCTNDTGCATTAYCNTSHKCVNKLGNGVGTCTAIDQCTSGVCGSNGVCCSGTCTVSNPPCGQTLACAAGTGACLNAAAGTTCSKVVSCNTTSNQVTTDTQCDGNGACANTPVTGACTGNFTCASASACNTTCSNDGMCDSTYYCGGNMCKSQGGAGASCGAPDQCLNAICGTTGNGNCCSAACTTGGTCGASGCDNTGTCQYPTSKCGAASCSGNQFTAANAGTCGNGACMPGTPGACKNNFGCQDMTTCATNCTANMSGLTANCAPTYTCNNGGNACLLSNGQSCSSGGQCYSNHCSTNCCTVACISGGSCGSTGCDTGGACNYPTGLCSGTPMCTGGNQVSTPTTCGNGTCSGGVSVTTCTGSLICVASASPQGCGCGTNDSSGDSNCPSMQWCDGTSNGNAGACQAPQAAGGVCNRNSQCTSGSCAALVCL